VTTENSDDLEIGIPDRSRSLKVTPVNFSCVISYYSLIVPEAVSYCTIYEIIAFDKSTISLYFPIPLLCLPPPTKGFPWDDLRKILHGGQRMAKVHHSIHN